VRRLRVQRVGMRRQVFWHMGVSLQTLREIKLDNQNLQKSKNRQIDKLKTEKTEIGNFQNLSKKELWKNLSTVDCDPANLKASRLPR
jgi:hypothetical protein